MVEGGEKGPAMATPETPTADAPPPTAAAAPSDVPNLDLGPPAADRVETMEGLVSLGDDRSGDLRVDRFSDPTSPPRPSASRPRPSSASPSRGSAAHGRPSAVHERPSAVHGRPSKAHGRASAPHRSPRRSAPKRQNSISRLQALMGVAFAVALGFVLTKVVPVASIGSGSGDAPAVGAASRNNATPAPVRAAPVRAAPVRAAPVQPTDTASVAIVPFDSILDSIDVDPGADSLPSLAAIGLDSTVGADSAPASVPLIRVEGLVVETVRALITAGRTGLRVIQILESGERLTLTIFPLSEDGARDLVDGEVHAANLTGSIVQGIVRFGDYEVRARATVSSDLLEALLQQLVEGLPTS